MTEKALNIKSISLTMKILCFFIGFSLFVGLGCNSNSEDGEYTNDDKEKENEDKERNGNDCGFEDGNHSATVDYYNPKTGHSATYNLSVDINDCEVTQINFNNGGWLDDSHISPTALDNDGNATLEDDEGREFVVHVDN